MFSGKDVETVYDKLSFEELTSKILLVSREGEVLGSIKELVRRKEPRRIEIFARVLDDPKYDSSIRKTVINGLGTEASSENQRLLLRQLEQHDDAVLVSTARALGKIGDENALKRLEAVKAPDNPTARHALEFAQSLISYRLGMSTHLISPPAKEQLATVHEGIRFNVSKAEAPTIKEAVSQARKDLPAISVSDEGAMKVTCRAMEYLLVFTDGFNQPEKLATLMQRNALPLVVLKTGLSEGRYFLDGYLFTHPSPGREVMLVATRPKGDLTLVGRVEISDDKGSFNLNAIESPFTPAVEISGVYDARNRSWEFEKTVTSTTIAAREGAVLPRKATRTFR